MSRNNDINAEVVSVSPNKLKISVDDLEEFKTYGMDALKGM